MYFQSLSNSAKSKLLLKMHEGITVFASMMRHFYDTTFSK